MSAIKMKKKKKMRTGGSVWVYTLFMAFPVVQFLLFTVLVSLNSFKLAFQEVDPLTHEAVGFTFNNFISQFEFLGTPQALSMIEMSVIGYLAHLLIGVPLGIIFAYYIYKKRLFAGAFRVLLFMPSIIPAIVLVTIFRFFVDRALPMLLQNVFALEVRPESMFATTDSSIIVVLFYNIFIGFGASVLMYANKMATIDPAITEAAELDGVTPFKEFWHIALPMTWSTVGVFLVSGIASIFMDQLNLFSFYGWFPEAGMQTLGYYFFYQSSTATTNNDMVLFSQLSALGLLMSLIAIPLTFLVRWIVSKIGPSEG